jgi:two-component system cell cycle sensor histidine kinase PleC
LTALAHGTDPIAPIGRLMAWCYRMTLASRVRTLAVLVLLLLHLCNLLLVLHFYHDNALRDEEARSAKAVLLAEHASRAFSAVDLTLEAIIDKLGQDLDLSKPSVFVQMLLDEHKRRLPQAREIIILDQDGVVTYDTRSFPADRLDLSDRMFFSEQKDWRGVGLYVGRAFLARRDGLPFFGISRPILDSDGSLRGVVALVAEPSYFSTFYGAEQLTRGEKAVLAREDGAILVGTTTKSDGTPWAEESIEEFQAAHDADLATIRPVPAFPAQIVVIGPPPWRSPGFQPFAVTDLGIVVVMTIILAWVIRLLAQEVERREEHQHALLRSEETSRQALAEARAANEAKTSFLATMSHELRTPLNAIIGFSETIECRFFGDDMARYSEYGGHICRSGKHLLSLINDVLDIAKVQSGKTELSIEPVSLDKVIAEAMEGVLPQAQKRAIRMSRQGVCLPPLLCDALRMRQVFLNLLSNAVKFTPQGGSVAVAAAIDERGIAIVVRDTGIGMAQRDIPKALMPFGQVHNPQTSHEGTGLGLPLAKKLVELQGGTFEIESELGIGTVVTIRFGIDGIVPPTRSVRRRESTLPGDAR